MVDTQDYFTKLPDEMIIQILLLLDHDSMLSARICCVRFESLLTGTFEKTSQFILDGSKGFILARNNSAHNWIFKTNKKLKNYFFTKFNFDDSANNDTDQFWNMHANNVISLDLSRCFVAEQTLNKILDTVAHLKYLRLGLLRHIDGAKIINKLFDRCVEITFTTETYIDEHEIDIIIASDRKSKIEELNLGMLKNVRHRGRLRDTGLYKLLNLIQPSLKRFELSMLYADDNCLWQLSQLNLDLEKLKISINDQIDNGVMLAIATQMKNLQILELNGNNFNLSLLSDENANVIYDNLHELRSLTFRECDALSNNGIINVTKLKKLEEFETFDCENLSNHGIVNGIASCINRVLKRLSVYGQFSDDTLIAIVNNLPELTTLEIESCLDFGPHLIPLVYERLPKLTALFISPSNSINVFHQLRNRHGLPKLLPEPILENQDIEVDALKNLTTLRIAATAHNIPFPGASMQTISKLKYLRELELHHYFEISKDDIIRLLKNCAMLKKIKLQCNDFLASVEDQQEIRKINPRIKTFSYNKHDI